MTESSERKSPEHQPWAIHCASPEGVPTTHDDKMRAIYKSLAQCEKACRELALANIGVTFTPVKFGKAFLAEKTEKVVIR